MNLSQDLRDVLTEMFVHATLSPIPSMSEPIMNNTNEIKNGHDNETLENEMVDTVVAGISYGACAGYEIGASDPTPPPDTYPERPPNEIPVKQPDEVPPINPKPPFEVPVPSKPDEVPNEQPNEVPKHRH